MFLDVRYEKNDDLIRRRISENRQMYLKKIQENVDILRNFLKHCLSNVFY